MSKDQTGVFSERLLGNSKPPLVFEFDVSSEKNKKKSLIYEEEMVFCGNVIEYEVKQRGFVEVYI